jgi:hypothetical protein
MLIENEYANLDDLRKTVYGYRDKLSPIINEKIKKLAADLHYYEHLYFFDVIRRAIGNSLPEPSDIIFDIPTLGKNACKRYLNLLEEKFKNNKTKKEFEKFVNDVLDKEEKDLPDTWVNLLYNRLDSETLDKWKDFIGNYPSQKIVTDADLNAGVSAYLNPLEFKEYKERLNRKLDDAIAEEVTKGLKVKGLEKVTDIPAKELQGTGEQKLSKSKKKQSPMIEAYFKAVEKTKISSPTLRELEDATEIHSLVWHRYLTDPVFVGELVKEFKKKRTIGKK